MRQPEKGRCICAESFHLSPAAQAVGGRAEAHRAPPSAVGKVPRPTHHPGQGGDSDHQLEAGQGLQSKVLLLPTASFPPPLYHQSMTRPSLTIFCLTLSLWDAAPEVKLARNELSAFEVMSARLEPMTTNIYWKLSFEISEQIRSQKATCFLSLQVPVYSLLLNNVIGLFSELSNKSTYY